MEGGKEGQEECGHSRSGTEEEDHSAQKAHN